jgi:hypothetical protein
VKIEAGAIVTPKVRELYCLCGDEACTVHAGDRLTVLERRYFPGLGAMLRFAERVDHSDNDDPPWYVASAFKPRYDA